MMTLTLPTQAPERRLALMLGTPECVHVTLVGTGGTGSFLARSLGQLAWTARQDGVEINLTFVDPDEVEARNVGRQGFCAAEIGRPKAETLARRVGGAHGIPVRYLVEGFEGGMVKLSHRQNHLNLLVGAVDNAPARRDIARRVRRANGRLWWLDCGNVRESGQVLIGNVMDADDLAGAFPAGLGYCRALPAPALQHPELLQARRPRLDQAELGVPAAETQAASCAVLAARGEQSLTVNTQVASLAFVMLYRLLITRNLDFFAAYFNSRTFTTGAIGITPANVERAANLPAGLLAHQCD